MLRVSPRGRSRRAVVGTAGALAASALVAWYGLSPRDYRAAAARGRAELERSRPVEALRAVADVRGPGRGAGEALIVAARAFFRLGQREDARRALERAAEIDPGSAEVARTLAPFRIMDGDTTGAIDLLSRAARIEPDDPRPWRAMGKLHFSRMEYDEALAAYREAVRRDPEDRESRVGFVKVLLYQSRTEEAGPRIAAALADEPEDPVVLGLAACQAYLTGRTGEATALADRALARDPNSFDALMARSNAALIEGRPEPARDDAERATRADPLDIAALHLLSQCEFRLGLTDRGRATVVRREEVRKRREEIAKLAAVISQRPRDPALHCLMGRIAAEAGLTNLAAESYRAALALEPRSRVAADGLASLRAASPRGTKREP